LCCVACGSDSNGGSTSDDRQPDLPKGWDDARSVHGFIQFACSGSAYEDNEEQVEARGAEGQVLVEITDAHFRCAQDVEAFYKVDGGDLDVLVQPVDMDPDGVAGCDCLYELFVLVDHLDERDFDLTVYRRWDNINDDNDPVKIGSAEVSATGE
jgi:hypothetical protein